MKYRLIDKTTGIETLCDKVTIDGFDYYVSDEKIHFGYVWNTILEQIETMFKEKTFHDDLKGVIATNNPNTGIPKVVTVSTLANKQFDEDMIDFAEFYFREEFNATMQDCKSSKEILQLWKKQKPKTVYYE